MMKKYITILIVLPLLLTQTTMAQTPGTLDLTYGNAGKVITKIPTKNGTYLYMDEVTKLSDGKIMAILNSSYYDQVNNYSYDTTSIVQFLSNGSLNPNFGTNGEIKLNFYTSFISLQADGKFIINGTDETEMILKRYLSNGQLDLSYGLAGTVYTGIYTGIYCGVNENSDRMYFSGTAKNNKEILLANIENSGIRNFNFGVDGLKTFDFDSSNNSEYPVKLMTQKDGKLIIVGTEYNPNSRAFIYRLNTDGTPDNSFSGDGKILINNSMNINDVEIGSDGKIVLGGTYYYSNYTRSGFTLARVNPNGTMDLSFSSTGYKNFNYGGLNDFLGNMIIQEDGKILVGGQSGDKFALARINTNGTFDMTFNGTGKSTTLFDIGSNSNINFLSLEPNQKIMAYGITSRSDSTSGFCMARYHSGTTVGLIEAQNTAPTLVYPNPFNNNLSINFETKSACKTIIDLYSIQGVLIQNLYNNERLNKGMHTEILNPNSDLKTGIYLLNLKHGDHEEWIKVVKE